MNTLSEDEKRAIIDKGTEAPFSGEADGRLTPIVWGLRPLRAVLVHNFEHIFRQRTCKSFISNKLRR